MSTIAIVGAGPGLGAAVARRFGREGFQVALISRTQANVDKLAEDLAGEGITARGYAADVRDPDALTAALNAAAEELGAIDVLQYSPIPHRDFLKPVLDTSPEDLRAAAEISILGFAIAVQQVLPGMRDRGHGTILLTNGNSAAVPNGKVAGTSVAFAGEAAYGKMLHDELATEDIRVGQLIIPLAIGGDDANHAPESLADRLWEIHAQPGPFRTAVEPAGE